MEDDPTAGDPNRTIQVDALADVELLDQDSESMEADAAVAPGPARPPPPLPYRRPSLVIIGVVVLLAGGLGAVGAYLIPSAGPAAVAPAASPAATSPAATSPAAESAPAESAPAEEEVVRHVPLGDEFIIRFDDDAGLPPTE